MREAMWMVSFAYGVKWPVNGWTLVSEIFLLLRHALIVDKLHSFCVKFLVVCFGNIISNYGKSQYIFNNLDEYCLVSQCNNLMLIESIPREPLSFHLVPYDNPRLQHTLQAKTLEQKREWCSQVKKYILESYNVPIPDKAKELLLTLTGMCEFRGEWRGRGRGRGRWRRSEERRVGKECRSRWSPYH